MRKTGILLLALLLVVGSIAFATGMNEAETKPAGPTYPEKAITMIVPYGAGGTTDLSGRQMAIQLSKHLGKAVTVVNQGGASGSIGAKTVLDAQPDGYTVLFTAESLGTQRVMGLSNLSYNDYTPILVAVNDPKVIVVNKTSKYNTLADLVNDIKARPGKVKMSYTGPGGSGHVQALIYNKFGMQMALTAYPGGIDCLVAVLGDQVDFTNSNFSTVVSYIQSGDLKLLGVSEMSRLPKYPEVPTLVEVIPAAAEYLKFPFTPLSLLVDKDVPAEVVQVLRAAANKAVQEPDWIAFVENNCLDPLYKKYPDEASAKEFYAKWESVVDWLLFDAGAAKFNPDTFGIPRP